MITRSKLMAETEDAGEVKLGQETANDHPHQNGNRAHICNIWHKTDAYTVRTIFDSTRGTGNGRKMTF